MKESASREDWEYYIANVIKYSLLLGEKLKADLEILELAATLHDIGRIKFSPKDHDITGAKEARKILTEVGYPEKVVSEVENCILKHRAKNNKPETLEEIIIANADAMAHLDGLPDLFSIVLVPVDPWKIRLKV